MNHRNNISTCRAFEADIIHEHLSPWAALNIPQGYVHSLSRIASDVARLSEELVRVQPPLYIAYGLVVPGEVHEEAGACVCPTAAHEVYPFD